MSALARMTHGTILVAAAAPLTLGLVAFLRGHINMQPWVIRLGQPAAALVLDGGTAYLLTGDFEGHFKLVKMTDDVRAGRRSPAGQGITDEKFATYAKRQFSQPTRIRHRVFGLWQEAPVSRWYRGPKSNYRRFSALGMSAALSSIPSAMLIARRFHSTRRRRRRIASNQCVNCAYNLTGLTEPRCPECATPFDQNRSMPANPSPSVGSPNVLIIFRNITAMPPTLPCAHSVCQSGSSRNANPALLGTQSVWRSRIALEVRP